MLFIFKSLIFILLLLHAAIVDMKTRSIPNYIAVMILFVGFIDLDPIPSILGLLLVPLPYFVMGLVREASIGGGDIKLMAACGFYLGLRAGYVGSIIGLLLAIVMHLSYGIRMKKNISATIPLAPYLGAGCLIAHIIFYY